MFVPELAQVLCPVYIDNMSIRLEEPGITSPVIAIFGHLFCRGLWVIIVTGEKPQAFSLNFSLIRDADRGAWRGPTNTINIYVTLRVSNVDATFSAAVYLLQWRTQGIIKAHYVRAYVGGAADGISGLGETQLVPNRLKDGKFPYLVQQLP